MQFAIKMQIITQIRTGNQNQNPTSKRYFKSKYSDKQCHKYKIQNPSYYWVRLSQYFNKMLSYHRETAL